MGCNSSQSYYKHKFLIKKAKGRIIKSKNVCIVGVSEKGEAKPFLTFTACCVGTNLIDIQVFFWLYNVCGFFSIIERIDIVQTSRKKGLVTKPALFVLRCGVNKSVFLHWKENNCNCQLGKIGEREAYILCNFPDAVFGKHTFLNPKKCEKQIWHYKKVLYVYILIILAPETCLIITQKTKRVLQTSFVHSEIFKINLLQNASTTIWLLKDGYGTFLHDDETHEETLPSRTLKMTIICLQST